MPPVFVDDLFDKAPLFFRAARLAAVACSVARFAMTLVTAISVPVIPIAAKSASVLGLGWSRPIGGGFGWETYYPDIAIYDILKQSLEPGAFCFDLR